MNVITVCILIAQHRVGYIGPQKLSSRATKKRKISMTNAVVNQSALVIYILDVMVHRFQWTEKAAMASFFFTIKKPPWLQFQVRRWWPPARAVSTPFTGRLPMDQKHRRGELALPRRQRAGLGRAEAAEEGS
jgi:hypothetical protein